MIFFGTRSKIIPGKVVEGIQCPNCENRKFITFGNIQYFHLYWIPTFSMSKTVGIECTHCKRTLIGKEIPADLAKQIESTVFNTKNTAPMFLGLIIIACLVLFGFYAAGQSSVQEAAYIEQPAANDLYIVNFTKIFKDTDPTYKYGILRIKQISTGQVEFQVSRVAYNKASGASKDIRKGKASSDAYYDTEPLFIDIKKLKSMKDSGAIYSIDRA